MGPHDFTLNKVQIGRPNITKGLNIGFIPKSLQLSLHDFYWFTSVYVLLYGTMHCTWLNLISLYTAKSMTLYKGSFIYPFLVRYLKKNQYLKTSNRNMVLNLSFA